jgi:hypothetical protein
MTDPNNDDLASRVTALEDQLRNLQSQGTQTDQFKSAVNKMIQDQMDANVFDSFSRRVYHYNTGFESINGFRVVATGFGYGLCGDVGLYLSTGTAVNDTILVTKSL